MLNSTKKHITLQLALLPFLLSPCIVTAKTLYVSEPSINVRSGPGLDNTIIAVAKMDQPLRLLSEKENWFKVEIPTGKQGWISSKMTKTEKPALYVIRDLKKSVGTQKEEIEDLLKRNREGQAKFNRQFAEFQKLKLKFKVLLNENKNLKEAKDILWLVGGVLFSMLIWTMGFLAGQYKIKKENKRFHNMATSQSNLMASTPTVHRKPELK